MYIARNAYAVSTPHLVIPLRILKEVVMHALVRHRYGSTTELAVEQIDTPTPGADQVLVLSLIHISEPTRPY